MTPSQAMTFIRKHGVVLESAHGPVPNFAEAIVDERISGSWWAHEKSHKIFRLTRYVRSSAEILVCRLVGCKITYVHMTLWPPLLRVADEISRSKTCAIEEIHTPTGKHATKEIAIERWMPKHIHEAARMLSRDDAIAALPQCVYK